MSSAAWLFRVNVTVTFPFSVKVDDDLLSLKDIYEFIVCYCDYKNCMFIMYNYTITTS